MKIAVLAGGVSPEHDVSMKSGSLVAAALSKRGHYVALCDVCRPVSAQKCAAFGSGGDAEFEIPDSPPSLSETESEYADIGYIGDGVLDLAKSADVCFLALHGGYGEDGHIQAVLESYGVIFTGSDMASCHAAMDKTISKLLCREAGMAVPPAVSVKKGESIPDFPLPAVIKPCGCGSSVGVSFVKDAQELKSGLDAAFEFDDRVIIEKMIVGREFSVSVLGEKALPSVEIVPHSGKYDFFSKYKNGMKDEICPGRLSRENEEKIERLALTAHNALGLKDYSRSDFIFGDDGEIYYLETNAIPGMNITSLLPRAALAVGISYGELCEKICAMALERNKK